MPKNLKFTAAATLVIMLIDLASLLASRPTKVLLALHILLWCLLAGALYLVSQNIPPRPRKISSHLMARFYVFFYFSWVCLLSGLVLLRTADDAAEFCVGALSMLVLFPGSIWLSRLRT